MLDGLPAWDDHGGGRLRFGPDGKLYLTRGDHGSNWLANACNVIRSQELPTVDEVRARDWSKYQGKILRLNLDGSIPDDNPLLNGTRSHIYTYGHRNPQGLVFAPNGLLYSAEHGPSTDDELNLITAGGNYGWPLVAGYKDDRSYAYANWSASSPETCKTLKFSSLNIPASVPQTSESSFTGVFVAPLATFFTVPAGYELAKSGTATIAPSGLDLYASKAIPGWDMSLIVTGMRTGAIYRAKLSRDGRHVEGEPIEYFKAETRYRDLAISPDGLHIYVSTDDHGPTMGDRGQTAGVPPILERSGIHLRREMRADMKRRAFLSATLGLAAAVSRRKRPRRRSRLTPPNVTGPDRTRCAIPIPTSSPSTIASAATSWTTRRSGASHQHALG